MADTPNYLGYLAQMPKQSGLERAIDTGVEMYGTLQKFAGEKQRQKLEGEKLKQAEMETGAMPGKLERAKTAEEQGITQGGQAIAQNKQLLAEGKLKLGALPGELSRKATTEEQDINEKNMLLKAYPHLLNQKLTAGDLENVQQKIKTDAAKMDISDLKHNRVQNELADIAETADSDPKLANEMWKAKRPGWISLGENPELIPNDLSDPKSKSMLNLASAHAPNRKEQREYDNLQAISALKVKGALTLAQQKTLDKGDAFSNELDKKRADSYSKFKADTNTAAKQAMTIKQDVDQMLSFATRGTGQFGYVKGRTMVLNTAGQENLKASNKLILDLFAQMPHIGRGGNLLLNIITSAKPANINTAEAYINLTKTYQAASEYETQFNSFVEKMDELGVRDETQVTNAWDRFESANHVVDKDGIVHPEIPKQWDAYFAKHPDDLPSSLVRKMKFRQIAQDQGIKPGAAPMPGLTKESQPSEAQAQSISKTGVVPAYNGQSPANLLTGE